MNKKIYGYAVVRPVVAAAEGVGGPYHITIEQHWRTSHSPPRPNYHTFTHPMNTIETTRTSPILKASAILTLVFFLCHLAISYNPLMTNWLQQHASEIFVFYLVYFAIAAIYLTSASISFVRSGTSCLGLIHFFFALGNFILALFFAIAQYMHTAHIKVTAFL